jgi:hypothetical protein
MAAKAEVLVVKENMSGEPTVIYRAANAQQAYLLKSVLEDQGIAAWVVNDAIQIAGGDLPLGWTAAPQVSVGVRDAETARQIAQEFDTRTAHEPTPDDATEAPAAEWADWPKCPQCGERRAVRCSVCGSSGTSFPLADIEETAAGQRVLLVCETCDDHFRPDFFRQCHRCGHDYGDGFEVERQWAPIELNARTWLVLGMLAVCAALFIGYFVWLMN